MTTGRWSASLGAIRLAALAGLLTGVAELLVLGFRKLVLGHVLHLGPQVVWMAPVADALLFLPAGVAAAIAARFWSRIDWLRALASGFVFLACFSVVLVISAIDQRAGVIFSLGFAVQAWRHFGRRPLRPELVGARSLPLLSALVLLLGIGVHSWEWIAERRAISRLPATTSSTPNVLLLVLDTVRALSLSLYGFDRPTSPELERFARRGVVFDRAFVSSPWTLPSHGSMFTGMAPHELSATWLRALDERHQTLAEALGARGFATAGFVANQFYGTPEFGLGRGFHRYRVFPRTPEELVLNSALGRRLANSGRIRHLAGSFDVFNRKRAPAVNRELLSWLSSLPEGTPFFAFLNFFDAHEPYLPPAPYDRQFATPGTWRPRSGLHFNLRQAELEEYRRKGLAPGALRGEQDAYEGSIAYLDHHIGSLIDSLEQRGVLDNTIVIITSDHGEGLGENGRFLHGRDLSRPALHVPLIVSFPGKVPAGRRVTEPVSLQDLAATVVDLAGVPNAAFPGTSWAGLWADSSRFHSGVVISSVRSYDHQSQGGSVVDGGLHLVRDWDGRVSLFDLEADPFEAQDLADDSVDVPQVSGLRTLLDTLIRARLR